MEKKEVKSRGNKRGLGRVHVHVSCVGGWGRGGRFGVDAGW